jgi:hypothetical protein
MINSISDYHRFATLGIKDFYVNLPITEIRHTTNKFPTIRGIFYNITKRCVSLFQTILNQNYYCYDDQYYKPSKGVSVGCPKTSIMAEINLPSVLNSY